MATVPTGPQVPTAPGAARSAEDEPTTPVARPWVSYWTLANLGMFLAYYGTQQILIPRQAGLITASSAASVSAQSWANIAAAAVTIVVCIATGALSDRTRHARGRRQIWVIGGALVAGVAFAVLGLQHGVLGLVLLWAVVQVGISAMTSALNAAVPDEVPANQRARVSAWYGVAQSVGPLLGILVVTTLLLGVISAYAAMAVLIVLLALPFAFGTRGTPLTTEQRPPLRLRSVLAGIVRPLRHADFAWAWGGRFFIQLSNALGQIYLYQFLKDKVHFNPDLGTLILVLVYTVAVVGAALPAGRISDRTGRRKRMVIVASVLQGAAGLLFAFWPTLPGGIIGTAMLGIGFGAYISVDQALITQVLPSAEDRGKDLGVIQVANTLPYIFAAAVGGLVIDHFGGYVVLYLLVLVTGLVAALCVRPIRSVR
jgi:MFS family permease